MWFCFTFPPLIFGYVCCVYVRVCARVCLWLCSLPVCIYACVYLRLCVSMPVCVSESVFTNHEVSCFLEGTSDN